MAPSRRLLIVAVLALLSMLAASAPAGSNEPEAPVPDNAHEHEGEYAYDEGDDGHSEDVRHPQCPRIERRRR